MIKLFRYIFYSFIIVLSFSGCRKEYSYEGGGVPSINDSVIITPAPRPYLCSSCIGADNYIEGKWSFYDVDTFYCGIIDTALATQGRDGFTFFGPSSCSIDSGLVVTVMLEPLSLTKDIFNTTIYTVGMYYYDNVGRTHPFISHTGSTFSLIIDSYIHQSKIMTGRFSGIVFKPNGQSAIIEGKYKLKMV